MDNRNRNRGVGARAAYLGDHDAVAGSAGLLHQMRAAERYAVANWASPDLRLFVDSGRPDHRVERGPAFERLLEEVRAGTIASVFVERYAVLAPTRAAARRAARELVAAGAELHVAGKVGRTAPTARDAGR